jgi:hypothetical protein
MAEECLEHRRKEGRGQRKFFITRERKVEGRGSLKTEEK